MLPCKITKFSFLVIFCLFIVKNESESVRNLDANRIHALGAEFLKKNDINPAELKTGKINRPKIPKYVRKLYKAMDELEHNLQSNEDKRKIAIHVYRPSGTIKHDKSVLYQLNKADVLKNDLTKAELVFQNRKRGPSVELKVFCSNDDQSRQIESSYTVDGIVADVTNCLKSENLESSLQFWIFVTHLRTNHSTSLRQIRHMDQFLVTFHNVDMRGLTEILHRGKRDTSQDVIRSVDVDEDSLDMARSLNICRLKPLFINFLDYGWDWVITPQSYNANICSGSCNLSTETYLNSTMYPNRQIVRHLRTNQTHTNEIPEFCCTAASYSDLAILYMDENNRVLFKILPDMKIVSCRCQ